MQADKLKTEKRFPYNLDQGVGKDEKLSQHQTQRQDVILYSFSLPKSGDTQLYCWIRSCTVFFYLDSQ